jgi:hypothetical protein
MELEGKKVNRISNSSTQASCTLNPSGSKGSNKGFHSAFTSSLSRELCNVAPCLPVSSINNGQEVDGDSSFESFDSPQNVFGHVLDI